MCEYFKFKQTPMYARAEIPVGFSIMYIKYIPIRINNRFAYPRPDIAWGHIGKAGVI